MFNKIQVRHLIISSLLIIYAESNSAQLVSHFQIPRSPDALGELKSRYLAASNYPAINSRIKSISGSSVPVDKPNPEENILGYRAFNYLPPTVSTLLGGNAYPNSLAANNVISSFGGGDNYFPSIPTASSKNANIPSGSAFNGLAASSVGRNIYNYLFGSSHSQNPLSGVSFQSIKPSLGSNFAGLLPHNIQSDPEGIYDSKTITSSYVFKPPSQSNFVVQSFDTGYPYSIDNLPYSRNIVDQPDQGYQPSPYDSLAYNQGYNNYNTDKSPGVPVVSYPNPDSRPAISGPISRVIANYIQRNPDVHKIISELIPRNSLLRGIISDQIPQRSDAASFISTSPDAIFRQSQSVNSSPENLESLL